MDIAALKAAAARWQRNADDMEKWLGFGGVKLTEAEGLREAATVIRSLIAHLEAMEAALKPFAEASGDLDDDHPDHWHLWEHAAAMSLSAGDLRRAKAALEPVQS